MEANKKQPNDVRVGFNSRISGIVSYCEKLFQKDKFKQVNFSAVGGSIGTLVNAVEVIKMIIPDLYQVNRLATISYQSVEEGNKGEVQNQRLYPKLEVILSTEKPQKTEGFQDKLKEDERKKLLEIKNSQPRPQRRGGFRGMRRGGFRGRRPGFRGRRGFRPMRGGRGRPPMRGRGNRPPVRAMRGGRGRGNRPPMKGGRGRRD